MFQGRGQRSYERDHETKNRLEKTIDLFRQTMSSYPEGERDVLDPRRPTGVECDGKPDWLAI